MFKIYLTFLVHFTKVCLVLSFGFVKNHVVSISVSIITSLHCRRACFPLYSPLMPHISTVFSPLEEEQLCQETIYRSMFDLSVSYLCVLIRKGRMRYISGQSERPAFPFRALSRNVVPPREYKACVVMNREHCINLLHMHTCYSRD